MKKKLKVCMITGLLSIFMFLGLGVTVGAATSTKTGGAKVQSDYAWALSTLYVDYNSSTKVVTGANMKRVYTHPAVISAKERVTALETYYAKGKLTATLAGTTKSNTVTVSTK